MRFRNNPPLKRSVVLCAALLLLLLSSCTFPSVITSSSTPAITTTVTTTVTKAPVTVTTAITPTSTTAIATVPTTSSTTTASTVKVQSVLTNSGVTGNITRRFDWSYKGVNWWYEVNLSNALYKSYEDRPRIQLEDWAVYATHPGNEWLTKGLADAIKRDGAKYGYSDYDMVETAILFAQGIPYTTDADTKGKSDYPRFPIETVVENTGDCEDHAFLLAAVTSALGYDTVLLDFPTHLAVGIAGDDSIKGTYYNWRGKRFYFIETTATGWKLGQVPDKFKGMSATIMDLTAHPVYFCTWSYPAWQGYIPLTVNIENRGSADATDVVVHAGCDAGNNQVWNQVKSASFNIGVDNKATVQINITPPRGKHTRVMVWVTSGDTTVHQSFGDTWFDTNP